MKLKSLQLKNFRVFEEAFITFETGLTTLIGENGSGKTTILEAIVWAIYGNESVRGGKESIRYDKAKPQADVSVTLIFELEGVVYKVFRTLKTAELFVNNDITPIVKSITSTTMYLIKVLGLEKDEFLNTYFTSQKELAFLAYIKSGIERGRFINKVLGYEKFREMQKEVASDKNILKKELEFLQSTLTNHESLQKELEITQNNLQEITSSTKEYQQALQNNLRDLENIKPQWDHLKQQKETFNHLTKEIEKNKAVLQEIETTITTLQKEIDRLNLLKQDTAKNQQIKERYQQLKADMEQQMKLQKVHMEKLSLIENIKNKHQRLQELKEEQQTILQTLLPKNDLNHQKTTLEKDLQDKTSKHQEVKEKVINLKQAYKAEISLKAETMAGIVSKKSVIETSGEAGSCPTCERTLGHDFTTVINHFNHSLQTLQDEITSITVKEDALKQEEKTLTILENEIHTLETDYKQVEKSLYALEETEKKLDKINKDIQTHQQDSAILSNTLETMPTGFNQHTMDSINNQLKELNPILHTIISTEAKISELEDKQKIIGDKNLHLKKIQQLIEQDQAILSTLTFSDDLYSTVERHYSENIEKQHQLQTQLLVLAEKETHCRKTLKQLEHNILERTQQVTEIDHKQKRFNYLILLEGVLGKLITEKSRTAAPQISAIASSFLHLLTDGRYDAVIVNDKYEIKISQDGETKEVISGGEEDIANLCVRLALSQMIAERTGNKLSLLIFDEIFGALDATRRGNVIDLIYSLSSIFQQVLLITHIEEVKSMVNNILEINYNEQTFSSSIVSLSETQFEDFALV